MLFLLDSEYDILIVVSIYFITHHTKGINYETGGLHELYKFSPVLQLKIEIREVKSQAVEFPERRVPVDRAGILCE